MDQFWFLGCEIFYSKRRRHFFGGSTFNFFVGNGRFRWKPDHGLSSEWLFLSGFGPGTMAYQLKDVLVASFFSIANQIMIEPNLIGTIKVK